MATPSTRPAPGPGPSTVQAPQADTGVPTCYRHPGRETYVSCVRCGRPACPDCLRSAAVGQQCVECIRQGNRGPGGRGAFGGRVATGAVVTWTLVALNVLLYVAELVDPSTIINDGALVGRSRSARPATSAWPTGSGTGCITSAFLHEPPG